MFWHSIPDSHIITYVLQRGSTLEKNVFILNLKKVPNRKIIILYHAHLLISVFSTREFFHVVVRFVPLDVILYYLHIPIGVYFFFRISNCKNNNISAILYSYRYSNTVHQNNNYTSHKQTRPDENRITNLYKSPCLSRFQITYILYIPLAMSAVSVCAKVTCVYIIKIICVSTTTTAPICQRVKKQTYCILVV